MSTNAATNTTHLRDRGGNWITGTVEGLEVQAKAYTEPSDYGMPESGRISKLWVKVPGGVVLYNYDRGLDVDHLKPEALAMIVAAVEAKIP